MLGAGAGVILSQGRVGRATAVPVVDKVLVIWDQSVSCDMCSKKIKYNFLQKKERKILIKNYLTER